MKDQETDNVTIEEYRERKDQWVAYLRSNSYTQGTGSLRPHTEEEGKFEYCCLGVACDLHSTQTGLGRWVFDVDQEDDYESNEEDAPLISYYMADPDGCHDLIWDAYGDDKDAPDPVIRWLGLTSGFGGTTVASGLLAPLKLSLIQLNDRLKWDFSKIADFIESEPPGLFTWNPEGGVNGETEHPLWEEALVAVDTLPAPQNITQDSSDNTHSEENNE